MKVAATLLSLLLVAGCKKDPPSTAEVLAQGGIYPVAVPLGWKLVNEAGKLEDIPSVAGDPFHKMIARGAILAQPPGPTAASSEAVMFTALHEPAPITQSTLDRYVDTMTKSAADKRVDEKLLLADPPRGRLVIVRTSPNDHRVERHYLLADAKGTTWQLVYLVQPENLDSWRPLFAAVEAANTSR